MLLKLLQDTELMHLLMWWSFWFVSILCCHVVISYHMSDFAHQLFAHIISEFCRCCSKDIFLSKSVTIFDLFHTCQSFWIESLNIQWRCFTKNREHDDDFNFEERFTSLKTELEKQISEEDELNKKIALNLSKIKIPNGR